MPLILGTVDFGGCKHIDKVKPKKKDMRKLDCGSLRKLL